MKIGVLALQGDFAEHINVLHRLEVDTAEVRLPSQLDDLHGLIIPGGESTTIGKLASAFDMIEPLRRFGHDRPIWGTCAGAIFLSRNAHRQQPLLNLMDITIERNAFGRQVNSFEIGLIIPVLEDPDRPYRALFIRAPLIERVGKGVEALAHLPEGNGLAGQIVAAQQSHLLATSFHPELTEDDRFHRFFINLAKG